MAGVFLCKGHFPSCSFEGSEGFMLSSFPAAPIARLTNEHAYDAPLPIKEGVVLPKRRSLSSQKKGSCWRTCHPKESTPCRA